MEAARLLWKLIKIACDNYGNLFGSDNAAAQKAIKDILTEKDNNWSGNQVRLD